MPSEPVRVLHERRCSRGRRPRRQSRGRRPGYTVAAARLIGARVGRIETARTAAAKLVDPRVASEVAVEESA